MKLDPIVEEIRETRRKIWEECGEDLETFIQYLKKSQEKHRDRLITKEELDRRRERERETAG